jgi:hypothetical protein
MFKIVYVSLTFLFAVCFSISSLSAQEADDLSALGIPTDTSQLQGTDISQIGNGLTEMFQSGFKTNDAGNMSGLGDLGKMSPGGNLSQQLGNFGNSSNSSSSGQGNGFFNSSGSFGSGGTFQSKGSFGTSGTGSLANDSASGSNADLSQIMSGQGLDNMMKNMPEQLGRMQESNKIMQDLLNQP